MIRVGEPTFGTIVALSSRVTKRIATLSKPLALTALLLATTGGCGVLDDSTSEGVPLSAVAPTFDGKIDVYITSRGACSAQTVESIPLEDYVATVLPCEYYANGPSEALKAQAVAIRSYAVYHALSGGKSQVRGCADVTDDESSQVYSCGRGQTCNSWSAVAATRGIVLARNGDLFETEYSNPTLGGHGRGLRQDEIGNLAPTMTYTEILQRYYGNAQPLQLQVPEPQPIATGSACPVPPVLLADASGTSIPTIAVGPSATSTTTAPTTTTPNTTTPNTTTPNTTTPTTTAPTATAPDPTYAVASACPGKDAWCPVPGMTSMGQCGWGRWTCNSIGQGFCQQVYFNCQEPQATDATQTPQSGVDTTSQTGADTQPEPPSPSGTVTMASGQTCGPEGVTCLASGVGLCAAGKSRCVDGKLQCTPSSPQNEVCDGLDNDCNGAVDDVPGGCANASACVPAPEICNGRDDDCDGFADEGNPGGGAACDVSGANNVVVAGTLVCAHGQLQCSPIAVPQAASAVQAQAYAAVPSNGQDSSIFSCSVSDTPGDPSPWIIWIALTVGALAWSRRGSFSRR